MLAADMVGQVERANKMLVPLRLQSLPKRPFSLRQAGLGGKRKTASAGRST
jgi:hypothetical protein